MGITAIENIDALVVVEPGTRTSQVALSGDGVRVVVFAFDAGAELTEHTAPGPIVVQALEGHLTFTAEGITKHLRPGGILHLDARIPHSVRAVEPSKMILMLLRKAPERAPEITVPAGITG
ncbi:cupin domain-containing protein [Microbacterium protaetiae]|uniref:Cupin domain-containing protein n=1 Tax=Microbacterium protaetiae TaxID=2509458 RepID=A0A4P6EJS1_9MICO|nr:cupin domain-containing protein [Microbacterium protaetiae]QAY60357.1 cupin domain-containing protein [Microbacterium protaetiae]